MSVDETLADVLQQLRAARSARGWNIKQAAQQLHITSTQVAALEEGRFQDLPGAAFARGYLRNYARLLDLNVEDVLAAYDQQQGTSGLRPSAEVLPRSELPLLDYSRKMLFFSILLAIALIILGWWLWGRPSSSSSAVSAAAISSPAAPSQSAAQIALSTPVQPAAAVTSSAYSVASVARASSTVGPAQSALAPENSGMRAGLVLHFSGDCWVQVRDGSGAIVLSTLAKAGQSINVTQGTPPYRILVGKASAVQITYAGKPVPLPANALNVARVEVGSTPVAATASTAVARTSSNARLAARPHREAQSSHLSRPATANSLAPAEATASDETISSEVAHATSIAHSAP